MQTYRAISGANVNCPAFLIKRCSNASDSRSIVEIDRIYRLRPAVIEVLVPEQLVKHLCGQVALTTDLGGDVVKTGQRSFLAPPSNRVLDIGTVARALVEQERRTHQTPDVRDHPLLAGVDVEILPELVHVAAKPGKFMPEQRHKPVQVALFIAAAVQLRQQLVQQLLIVCLVFAQVVHAIPPIIVIERMPPPTSGAAPPSAMP